MDNKTARAQVFYRAVKAGKGHPFAGLYAVEKVYIRDGVIYKKEIVHEWDLRILSESILAKLGGSAAFDAYKEDNEVVDQAKDDRVQEVVARTKEDLKDLTKQKLNKELKFEEPE